MAKKINVPGRLHSVATGNILSGAVEIYDDVTKKNQQVINKEVAEHIDTLDNRSTQMENAINDISVTGGASTASAVSYNNSTSKLEAITAQGAIDEVSSIVHFAKRGGIVNISTNYNSINTAEVLTLEQAIAKVPSSDRVLGFQGKFLSESGWKSYVFIGDSIADWTNKTKWNNYLTGTDIVQESGESEDKVMSQKAVSDKFSDLLISVKEESNPFDLSDEEGNVALRLENGHIKTKEFDSSLVENHILKSKEEALDESKKYVDESINTSSSNSTTHDFDLSDENGNVALRLNNGDLETANFSSKTTAVKDNLWSHDYDSPNWFDGDRLIHVVNDDIVRSCVFPCKGNKTYSFLRQNKDWYSEPKYSEIIFLDINKNVIGGTCNKQFPEYPTLNAQLYTNNIKIFNDLRYIVFTTPSNCAYFMANLYINNQWDSRDYNIIVDKTQILNNVDVENSAVYNKYPIRDVETRDLVLKALYPWSNKTWCALGDSLTEKNQWAKYQYWDYISAETGIKPYIRGISGSGFYWGKPANGTDEQLHEYSFARRLKNTDLDGIDVLTVFGSFNDLLNPTDPMSILGTVNDTTEDTIGGAINVGIQNFINRCSDTKIGIITPTPWQSSGNCTRENQDKYVELLISICRKYHIPYLDLYHFSGLQPDNADWRSKYYDSDNHEAVGSEQLHNGIHPNSLGHKYFHGMIREFLKSLI